MATSKLTVSVVPDLSKVEAMAAAFRQLSADFDAAFERFARTVKDPATRTLDEATRDNADEFARFTEPCIQCTHLHYRGARCLHGSIGLSCQCEA